jgi:hypothetical protein
VIAYTLNEGEQKLVREKALARRTSAQRKRRKNAYGFDGDGEAIDILGMAGEYVACRILDRPFDPVVGRLDREEGDIGTKVQVRTTSHRKGHLLIHPEDPDDHAYILIVGEMPTMYAAGWLRARDAKKKEWWREPQKGRPCFMVPQSALRDVPDRRKRKPRFDTWGSEPPPCFYKHYPRWWRVDRDRFDGKPGHWVCEECHPCSFPDTIHTYDANGKDIIQRIERRDRPRASAASAAASAA